MITGIILASGFSFRMKKDKLLLKVDKEYIIEKLIKEVKKSELDEALLIFRSEEVGKIGEKHGIKTVYNEKAYLGQSESLKLGIMHSNINSEAFMFLVGDQPFLDSSTINKLLFEYRNTPQNIIVPCYGNNRGNPTIFPSVFKGDLLKIEGDIGGRLVMEKYPYLIRQIYIENERIGLDIDTSMSYENMKNIIKKVFNEDS